MATILAQVHTFREQKKMADKQRKLAEKAHRVKEESLRDDDNVFDVAFENQGAETSESVVSATDIKVCTFSACSEATADHCFGCIIACVAMLVCLLSKQLCLNS